MLSQTLILASAFLPALSSAQVIRDPGIAGPPLELVHLYNDQWPTGAFPFHLKQNDDSSH
jgi:hypothetical protein